MPATRTTSRRPSASRRAAKPAAKGGTARSARDRFAENGRIIDRVVKSLEAAQADLTSLRGTVGSGATDLRKDVARMLRDARRDLTKMSKTVRRDLERAQRDLAAAAKGPSRSRRGAPAKRASKPRSRGAAK